MPIKVSWKCSEHLVWETAALKYEHILPGLLHIYELRFLLIVACSKGEFIVIDRKYMYLCMCTQIRLR